jgi:hypothetical protein
VKFARRARTVSRVIVAMMFWLGCVDLVAFLTLDLLCQRYWSAAFNAVWLLSALWCTRGIMDIVADPLCRRPGR